MTSCLVDEKATNKHNWSDSNGGFGHVLIPNPYPPFHPKDKVRKWIPHDSFFFPSIQFSSKNSLTFEYTLSIAGEYLFSNNIGTIITFMKEHMHLL